MTPPPSSHAGPAEFPLTRWSVVLAAREQDSAAALEVICRAYWQPLYAYVRRCGQTPHDAQDLTQEFFHRLLEKGWLAAADREKGRLRTFLIVALKNFMAKEWRAAAAQRRGGRVAHVPMDTRFAESRLAAQPDAGGTVDEAYDRQWAITVLDLTLERLLAEYSTGGHEEDFDVLKGCLMAARGQIDYAALAAQLGASEGSARVAVHRLRKRFREVYREEIAHTLAHGADLDEEMRHLAAALARG